MKSPSFNTRMPAHTNQLMDVAEVSALIEVGAQLALAGRAEALQALPKGNWIGGTTPYFMTAEGGQIVDASKVFVSDFSDAAGVSVQCYASDELERISADAPANGFALAILPYGSVTHERFATEAASYPMAFLRPTVGWIAGFDLSDANGEALVFDGRTGAAHRDHAAVLHVALEDEALVSVEIVNLFRPDEGDVIHFESDSFTPDVCIVNGERRGFADYLRERGLEGGQLPLIGDFSGVNLNASIRAVDGDKVALYAPVFTSVDYRFAAPVGDYAGAFQGALAARSDEGTMWSCNCILNFLFGELEGKAIGGVAGPITFGEIAYQLLNQTLVRVRAL